MENIINKVTHFEIPYGDKEHANKRESSPANSSRTTSDKSKPLVLQFVTKNKMQGEKKGNSFVFWH